MEIFVIIFWMGVAVAGTLFMAGGIAWCVARAYVFLLEQMKIWRVLALIAARHLHGKHYREQLFWDAAKDFVSNSNFAADRLIEFVNANRPDASAEDLI